MIDSRIINARPPEISMSIRSHVQKAFALEMYAFFFRDLKCAIFQLILEWLVTLF